jgi:hypothetical protein
MRFIFLLIVTGLYNAVRPLLNLALAEDGDLGNRVCIKDTYLYYFLIKLGP